MSVAEQPEATPAGPADEVDEVDGIGDVEGRRNGQGGAVLRREPQAAERDARRHQRRQRRTDVVLAALPPIVLFAAWQWAAGTGAINDRYFPPPTDIWAVATDMVSSGDLQSEVWVTVKRVLIGFGLGGAIGVTLGVALGTVRRLRVALEPLLSALYTVPKLALLPLFFLLFGLGESARIAVIVVTVFFFMWISTQEAIAAVPNAYHEAVDSFGAGWLQRLRHVTLPAALPGIFVGLQISAGVSVLVVIGVEFVQGGNGVGHLIWFSWSLFRADRMYVGIVVAGLMGFLFTSAVRLVGRRVLPWALMEQSAGRAA